MTSQTAAAPYVPVGEFFSERSVFVTGATGFLGKVLVEKLLRSCPGVKVIYLLMRPKRGRGLEARLADVVDSPLFERLKRELPTAVNKLVPIHGDIGEPDLGISLADQETLTRNVSVVFHSAATVKFDEPMKVAVQINLLGTRRVVDLCRRMPELQALVHVSTCYANCDLEEVLEVVYPPPYDPDHIAQCAQWMDDELLAHMTPKLLGKRPNTYTFTKALTENMIVKEGVGLPIAIVRPSIITASWKEPMAGWIEGLGGMTGCIAAYGKGMLRSVVCDGKKVSDIIPVDVVVNLMIVAAWRIWTTRENQLMVYNCCSGARHPLTYDKLLVHMYNTAVSHPSQHVMWYPSSAIFCANQRTNEMRTVLLQILPAYLLDYTKRLSNKKSMVVRIDQKIRKNVAATSFARLHEWHFKDVNTLNLSKCLSKQDRQNFFFDIIGIDWPSYVKDYVIGVRAYIHKEKNDTIPQARVSLNRLLWIQRATQLFGLLLVMQGIMYIFYKK